MRHPTTRVLTVLELLQVHPRLSSAEIAARLEVDRRTVRRYVATLQELGFPIESEPGRYGGYRLRSGYKLPPLTFTEDEAFALTAGLLAARRLGLAAFAPAVEGAFAKLDRALPAAMRSRVEALYGTLAFTPGPTADEPSEPATILTLGLAAQRRNQVWLRYRSAQNVETDRVLDPYGLVHHRGCWYATGWCHLRGGPRVFRLDRVLEVELREGTFVRPPDFDAADYVLHSLATMPFEWQVEVLLDLPLAEARRRVPPHLATLEDTPRGVLLRTLTDDLLWVARTLVGFGCGFSVRRPTELKAALHMLATEIVSYAEGS